MTSQVPGDYVTIATTQDDVTRIVLTKSPDLEEMTSGEEESVPQSVQLTLDCVHLGRLYKFPETLVITDVNELPPVFDPNIPLEVNVSESAKTGSAVFDLLGLAHDPDVTGFVTSYSIQPMMSSDSSTSTDGHAHFGISASGTDVVVTSPLDYDTLVRQEGGGGLDMVLNLTAVDNGSPPLTSTAVLGIHVTDSDDLGPAFLSPDCPISGELTGRCATPPYYQALVRCSYKGPLVLHPGPIAARDLDSHNHRIVYSITRVEPSSFSKAFVIDSETGHVDMVSRVCGRDVTAAIFVTIQATEDSGHRHSSTASLQVNVLDNMQLAKVTWSVVQDDDLDPDHLNDTTSDPSQDSASSSSVVTLQFFSSLFTLFLLVSVTSFLVCKCNERRKRDIIECREVHQTAEVVQDGRKWCSGRQGTQREVFQECHHHHGNSSNSAGHRGYCHLEDVLTCDVITTRCDSPTSPAVAQGQPQCEPQGHYTSSVLQQQEARRDTRRSGIDYRNVNYVIDGTADAPRFDDNFRFSESPAVPDDGSADAAGSLRHVRQGSDTSNATRRADWLPRVFKAPFEDTTRI